MGGNNRNNQYKELVQELKKEFEIFRQGYQNEKQILNTDSAEDKV